MDSAPDGVKAGARERMKTLSHNPMTAIAVVRLGWQAALRRVRRR
jgi:hypothetical protein